MPRSLSHPFQRHGGTKDHLAGGYWWILVAQCEQEDGGCTPGCVPQSYFMGREGRIRDFNVFFFVAVSLPLAMPAVWVTWKHFYREKGLGSGGKGRAEPRTQHLALRPQHEGCSCRNIGAWELCTAASSTQCLSGMGQVPLVLHCGSFLVFSLLPSAGPEARLLPSHSCQAACCHNAITAARCFAR